MILRGFHSHRCPHCYGDACCEDACTIEPDQSDAAADGAILWPRGSYAECDECRVGEPLLGALECPECGACQHGPMRVAHATGCTAEQGNGAKLYLGEEWAAEDAAAYARAAALTHQAVSLGMLGMLAPLAIGYVFRGGAVGYADGGGSTRRG